MKRFFYLLLGVMCVSMFASCHMQKRVTIPSGGQLVARSVVVKEEVKQDTLTKVVKNEEIKAVEVASPVVSETVVGEPIKKTEVVELKVDSVPEVKAPVVVTTPPAVEVKVRRESFAALDKQDEVEASKDYHVVVGSFGKQDNATRLRAVLASQGRSPIIVVNEQGMYRVIAISCETYEEAHRAADEVRDVYPDAWILAQKQK